MAVCRITQRTSQPGAPGRRRQVPRQNCAVGRATNSVVTEPAMALGSDFGGYHEDHEYFSYAQSI